MLIEVSNCQTDSLGVVFELPQTSVAEFAQDAAHLFGAMIVIYVEGWSLPADGARPPLGLDHRVDFGGPNAVFTFQVIVASASTV